MAPASHGDLTWRYASHYITASQWLLSVSMNYRCTVTLGNSEQLRALNHAGLRRQLPSDWQGVMDTQPAHLFNTWGWTVHGRGIMGPLTGSAAQWTDAALMIMMTSNPC